MEQTRMVLEFTINEDDTEEYAGRFILETIRKYYEQQGLSPMEVMSKVLEIVTPMTDAKGVIKATDLGAYLGQHQELGRGILSMLEDMRKI